MTNITVAKLAKTAVPEIKLPEVIFDRGELARAKAIGLFLLAPFIGLVYAMAMPFVGIGMIVYLGAKAFAKNTVLLNRIKETALFVAAPFIGLAYAVAMPFIGIGMIAYLGFKAALKR